MEGLVTLLEANRPTVESVDGAVYLCYIKGRIKRDVGRIMVGDRVMLAPTDPGEARIDEVLPRFNQLVRPPVSNVTGVLVVFSLAAPTGSLELLDKRLVAASILGMRAEIVFSKVDLLPSLQELEVLEAAYRAAGYPVWRTASTLGEGVGELAAPCREGIWVLTGESGVGKSTLLNALLPQERAQTQQLGRFGRGQQTTRWVRLYRLNSYWLADSPGYTALDSMAPTSRAIAAAFPEFESYQCRFADCLHGQEPGCAVSSAVLNGTIPTWRYQHYRKLVSEWVKIY